MQRSDHVVEPIWAALIQLATSYIQGQAPPSQVSGTVPAAATSASHLVSELLTRYGHDAGTAAMIAVSNEGAQLWSQLGRSASIQQLGSASPIAPTAPPPSSQALPRVFSNADSPTAGPPDPAPSPNPLGSLPTNLMADDEDASISGPWTPARPRPSPPPCNIYAPRSRNKDA
jgi:hypothetical protein